MCLYGFFSKEEGPPAEDILDAREVGGFGESEVPVPRLSAERDLPYGPSYEKHLSGEGTCSQSACNVTAGDRTGKLLTRVSNH
jgi:hypothetical protein